MSWIVLVAVVFVVAAFIAVALLAQKKNTGDRDGFPYQKAKALFSPAERSFFGVLEQAVTAEYRVFAKVRIADVVSVKSTSDRTAWQRAFNRINAKHFDFVLCRPGDLSVACAIELDDKSHEQGRRQDRDGFVAGVCRAIALPLLQLPAKQAYSIQTLREQVAQAIDSDAKVTRPATAPGLAPAAAPVPPRS